MTARLKKAGCLVLALLLISTTAWGLSSRANEVITGEWRFMKPVRFNNVKYTWPSADGSSTEVLQTDGSGTLSWVANAGGNTDWENIGDPSGANAIDMTTYATTFDFGGTVDMFTLEFTAAFADVSGMVLEQKTGDPTDGTLLELKLADNDPDFLSMKTSGTEVLNVTDDGVLTLSPANSPTTIRLCFPRARRQRRRFWLQIPTTPTPLAPATMTSC
ncbi:hypothetical protein LCGC14_0384440 [marine sediment metagenome]|uniref:Uncharacterized protein n=1 Tax=marine sediment metagenome TaxID=412755 RepID=A0A0F9T1B2_9ZZZZ